MLASNYSENLNLNLNNKKLSAFTPTVSSTTSPTSSSSSSLDYLYQAITLIEEAKNSNSTTINSSTHENKDEIDSLNKFNNVQQFINNTKSNGCTNPCCNCRNSNTSIESHNKTKTKKRVNDSDSGGGTSLKSNAKSERQQQMSKYKKIKTYDANYPDLNNNNLLMNNNLYKPNGMQTTNRFEKVKNSARKPELRLNINNEPLTPISSSSLSPQSVKSVISPSASPFINSQQSVNTQSSAFNYYPIEVISNLLPFYFTPFANTTPNSFNSQQVASATNLTPQSISPIQSMPNLPPHTSNILNNDPNYLQNLINTIYSLANYQQFQQLQSSLINPLNSNNLILYSIQQQLQQQQQQRNSNPLNISNPIQQPSLTLQATPQLPPPPPPPPQQLQPLQPKKTSEPLVKSKLISYINESDIENKVNEHFRRSLGSKYLKISNKLNKSSLNKPKKRTLSDSCDATNSTNATNRLVENTSETSLNYDDLNYDDDEETFIEFTTNGTNVAGGGNILDESIANPLSPVSTVSASDSYSRASINDDDLIQNEILDDEEEIEDNDDEDDENTLITSAATNNTLLFSPVSNTIAEVNY